MRCNLSVIGCAGRECEQRGDVSDARTKDLEPDHPQTHDSGRHAEHEAIGVCAPVPFSRTVSGNVIHQSTPIAVKHSLASHTYLPRAKITAILARGNPVPDHDCWAYEFRAKALIHCDRWVVAM